MMTKENARNADDAESRMTDAVKAYAEGGYIEICQHTQDVHGGSGPWDDRCSLIGEIDASTAETAEALFQFIAQASATPVSLTRTEVDWSGFTVGDGAPGRSERYGTRPEVGQRLSWGVKSASAHPDWARLVARMEAPGMSMSAKRNGYSHIKDGAEVIAYHIENATRYIDISDLSQYDQRECLVCGEYVVTSVTEEDVSTTVESGGFNAITASEQAAREGAEPEWFTSKHGNAMVRYGTHTYPAEYWDQPKITLIDEPIYLTAHIVHVYLKEV